MLSFQTVLPDTLELLRILMRQPILNDMRLVGGTALALQYGHRRSIDLDFFGHTTEDADELTEALKECVHHLVRGSYTKRIKAYMLNDVKVDIVNYDYEWIDEPVIEDGIRLASPKDIAAMKVNAVIGRGTKKDFIDIFFLLQHFSFEDIMNFYFEKYPDGSEYRALLSMTYFADADPQPMPVMFAPINWNNIKLFIGKEVEEYTIRRTNNGN
ncbi:MAG: nucleotidyl transferase AbiEii/AbiGii toxin family protein [Bacteroidaceae bacterium]|nr:nucleotidyl transferase AbiEii/AbiGii toxin family protein [Bacteroidaceae bacterium]